MTEALDFTSHEHGDDLFLGVTPLLFRLAARGDGTATLAHLYYGSPDYTLVNLVFHEAGHAATARWFGESARVTLYSWAAGACEHWLPEGGYRPPGQLRSIALAGSIAGQFAQYGIWETDKALQRHFSFDVLSTSDRINAGRFTPADVSACASLVRDRWSAVVETAADVHNANIGRWYQ